MIVAVDGPAGSGKSTICRLLAKRLGWLYLDTGAMYRGVAWAIRYEDLVKADEGVLEARLPRMPLRFMVRDQKFGVRYGSRNLDTEIRTPDVTVLASRISRRASVRRFLVEWQRRLADGRDVIAEGRDMGTVVFPRAELKVFLTAELMVRARRRQKDLRALGVIKDLKTISREIAQRDDADSRRHEAPLRVSEGAMILDTSGLSVDEAVERMTFWIQQRRSHLEGKESEHGKSHGDVK